MLRATDSAVALRRAATAAEIEGGMPSQKVEHMGTGVGLKASQESAFTSV